MGLSLVGYEEQMNCGCQVDVALVEFYLFKTGRLTSVLTGESEGWKDMRLDPRTREAIVTEYLRANRLVLEDLYSGGWVETKGELQEERKRILNIQVGRMTAELGLIEIEQEEDRRVKAEKGKEVSLLS